MCDETLYVNNVIMFFFLQCKQTNHVFSLFFFSLWRDLTYKQNDNVFPSCFVSVCDVTSRQAIIILDITESLGSRKYPNTNTWLDKVTVDKDILDKDTVDKDILDKDILDKDI